MRLSFGTAILALAFAFASAASTEGPGGVVRAESPAGGEGSEGREPPRAGGLEDGGRRRGGGKDERIGRNDASRGRRSARSRRSSEGRNVVGSGKSGKGGGKSGKGGGYDYSGKSGKSGKSEKSEKSGKSRKSRKSGKPGKYGKIGEDYGGKSNKSGKSGGYDYSGKSGKSRKSGKPGNSGKSGGEDHGGKSNKSDKSGGYDHGGKTDKSGEAGTRRGRQAAPRPKPRKVARRPTWEPTCIRAGDVPFRFFSRIAEDFLDDEEGLEASGIDVAPDGSHLVLASDDGRMIFLDLRDRGSGRCLVDEVRGADGGADLEGVAIDPSDWSPDDMHAYVVHEGNGEGGKEPMLYKIRYEYDPDGGSCSAGVVDAVGLGDALPCLETKNGVESLALKTASRDGEPAVFFVGVQDTGKVYEVTSGGESHSSRCYDGGLGGDDTSGATFDAENGHLWSYAEGSNAIAVVDTDRGCTVAKYRIGTSLDEEGLAIDFRRGLLYLVVDGQGDGSVVSVYNFTYPDGLDECLGDRGSCDGFETCGDKRRRNSFG